MSSEAEELHRRVRREIHRVQNLPYGTARAHAARAIAKRVEEGGPRELLPEVLLNLVEAYAFSNLDKYAISAFSRVLRLWDDSPELFDQYDSYNLFWEYKWISGMIRGFPEISLAAGEGVLADMRRRYQLAGHDLTPVLKSEFLWADSVGAADAEQRRLAWLAAGEGDMNDCRACDIGTQVNYFVDRERYEEAIAIGLTQDESCQIEPRNTYLGVAIAALRLGDAQLAQESYGRALAVQHHTRFELTQLADELMLLGEGGCERRVVELLRENRGELLNGANPGEQWVLLHQVARALTALIALRPEFASEPSYVLTEESLTFGELRERFGAQAMELAERFDARNGNSEHSSAVRESLAARPAPVRLVVGGAGAWAADEAAGDATPAAAAAAPGAGTGSAAGAGEPQQRAAGLGTSAGQGAGETASGQESRAASKQVGAEVSARPGARVSAQPEDAPRTGAALFDRGEKLARERDWLLAAANYSLASREYQREGDILHAGAAAAEAGQAHAEARQAADAVPEFVRAIGLLTLGGASPLLLCRVAAAFAPVACRAGNFADAYTLLEKQLEGARVDASEAQQRLTEALGTGSEDFAELEQRSRLTGQVEALTTDTLARTLAETPRELRPAEYRELGAVAALAEQAAMQLRDCGTRSEAAHALWLAAKLVRTSEEQTALTRLREAFALMPTREKEARAALAGELSEALEQAGLADEAADVIAEL